MLDSLGGQRWKDSNSNDDDDRRRRRRRQPPQQQQQHQQQKGKMDEETSQEFQSYFSENYHTAGSPSPEEAVVQLLAGHRRFLQQKITGTLTVHQYTIWIWTIWDKFNNKFDWLNATWSAFSGSSLLYSYALVCISSPMWNIDVTGMILWTKQASPTKKKYLGTQQHEILVSPTLLCCKVAYLDESEPCCNLTWSCSGKQ